MCIDIVLLWLWPRSAGSSGTNGNPRICTDVKAFAGSSDIGSSFYQREDRGKSEKSGFVLDP